MSHVDPGLQLTDSALAHIRHSLKKADSAIGIRIGVRKAGCSGYEYVLEYAYPDSQRSLDRSFQFDDITVLIDKEVYAKFFKGGTTLDHQRQGMKEGLHFVNPNVAHQCGCGESFTLNE